MRSIIKSRAERGFTLIEVLVALAVAGGALVLVLSANNASLRKSVRARLDERLERVAESTFAEWQIGAEHGSEGQLKGFEGHRWEVRSTKENIEPLKKVFRVTFSVVGPSGKVLEWSLLRESAEDGP
jgi:prepilin-type N-terminal cleavage/methylation domain-containing protein